MPTRIEPLDLRCFPVAVTCICDDYMSQTRVAGGTPYLIGSGPPPAAAIRASGRRVLCDAIHLRGWRELEGGGGGIALPVSLSRAVGWPGLSALAREHTLFADYAIQGDVSGLCRQLFDPLEGMREAEQTWSGDMRMPLSECECPIVITATHAEPVAVIIEAEQGHDHQVELAGRDQATAAGQWFGNAEAVVVQSVTGSPVTEPQLAMSQGVQHRQVEFLAWIIDPVQQRHGIDFAIAAEIGRNVARAPEPWMGLQAGEDPRLGSCCSLGRQCSPLLLQALSKGGLICHLG